MSEAQDKCVKPAKGPIVAARHFQAEAGPHGESPGEAVSMFAKVGKPAPDFELSAFVNGGFDNVRLSNFKGKWIVLCFYPGDFTFV